MSRSLEAQAYQWLYKTKAWRMMREWQLTNEPFCRMCKNAGRRTTANIADHIVPHRGDTKLFWDRSNLQSLCDVHHNEKTWVEEGGPARAVIGADGWPTGGRGG